MTVKLILLKSGEDIIADVTEMIVGENENKNWRRKLKDDLFKKLNEIYIRKLSNRFPLRCRGRHCCNNNDRLEHF